MIIRARIVVTMDGTPIEDGAVVVAGNRIVAAGTSGELVNSAPSGAEVIDLGDVALLPGLINAHCHLDYTTLRNVISPAQSFTAWVQRINAIKRTLDSDDWLASIAKGFSECRKWGTTTVCNIESFPELMPKLPPSPIRTWWFYEMIDIRHRITTDDVVAGALAFFEHRGSGLDSFGLSPHAPFTASLMLYRLADDCATRFGMPLTTHVAESREEYEMFKHGRGPLHEFLLGLQRPADDWGATPFAHVWRSGAINDSWLLTHMNELEDGDFRLLEEAAPNRLPHVVHCPGSHRYFGHSPFPLQRLRELGINICIGTDSLASTDSLSLLSDLRTLHRREPSLSWEDLLSMVTRNPARALRRDGQLGVIKAGALADLIAIPATGTLDTIHEEIVSFAKPIPWMMIDGQVRS